MHFEFDAKIDHSIQKAVRSAVRLYKDQQDQALERGPRTPPSFESFMSTVNEFMETNKNVDLNKLRTPSLRDLFERAWTQRLRNYATQEQIRGAHESLVRRYRARNTTSHLEQDRAQ